MKIKTLESPAAGTWARDCELIYFTNYKGVEIAYHKDSDDTYWSIRFEHIVAYKLLSEEFSLVGYLIKLPIDGAFYEIFESPWISEFGKEKDRILDKCRHFIFRFYDETLEVIAQNMQFEKLSRKPSIQIDR